VNIQSQPHIVKTIEAGYTVSGLVFSTLHCSGGMLDIGLTLSDEAGQTWKIIDHNLEEKIKLDDSKRQKIQVEKLYMYLLEPIGHLAKPEIGILLDVINKGPEFSAATETA
jgi:hypothetical protein